MRRAFLFPVLAALIAVPGCDSDGTTGTGPEPDPVPVTITYRVSVTGTVFDPSVSYTDASGTQVFDSPDFSRASVYTQEVEVAAGTTGTFALSATATVGEGQRLNVSILAAETDDASNEAASASDIAISTAADTELTASAEINLQALFPAPEAN